MRMDDMVKNHIAKMLSLEDLVYFSHTSKHNKHLLKEETQYRYDQINELLENNPIIFFTSNQMDECNRLTFDYIKKNWKKLFPDDDSLNEYMKEIIFAHGYGDDFLFHQLGKQYKMYDFFKHVEHISIKKILIKCSLEELEKIKRLSLKKIFS